MSTNIFVERIENVADGDLHVHHTDLDEITSRQRVQKSGIALDPYVVLNGQPQADQGYGVRSESAVHIDILSSNAGEIPAEAQIVTDVLAATQRFLPRDAYQGISGGVNRWWDIGGNSGTYPQLIARRRFGAIEDPILDNGYGYLHGSRRILKPAFTMNQQGYFELRTTLDPTANYASATLCMVVVPHAGPGGYYPLYDSGRTSSTVNGLAIRYGKGDLNIYTNEGRLLTHKVLLEHSEPIIMIVSFDGPTDTGRLVVVDRRHTSRTFSSAALAGVDFNGLIGVRYLNGTSNPDWNVVADMDLLEVDTWLGKALNFHEMNRVANILSAVYQVGP